MTTLSPLTDPAPEETCELSVSTPSWIVVVPLAPSVTDGVPSSPSYSRRKLLFLWGTWTESSLLALWMFALFLSFRSVTARWCLSTFSWCTPWTSATDPRKSPATIICLLTDRDLHLREEEVFISCFVILNCELLQRLYIVISVTGNSIHLHCIILYATFNWYNYLF